MKLLANVILTLALYCCFTQTTIDKKLESSAKHENFKLHYSHSGLGSQIGSMQPTFRVTGNKFVYTREQNSYYRIPTKNPEAICEGLVRTSSIDSILNLVKDVKDTLIYRTNAGIMSGGIHYISVKNEHTNVSFKLHNASDSTAHKIVDILNSNIPADKPKLWLFELPEKK